MYIHLFPVALDTPAAGLSTHAASVLAGYSLLLLRYVFGLSDVGVGIGLLDLKPFHPTGSTISLPFFGSFGTVWQFPPVYGSFGIPSSVDGGMLPVLFFPYREPLSWPVSLSDSVYHDGSLFSSSIVTYVLYLNICTFYYSYIRAFVTRQTEFYIERLFEFFTLIISDNNNHYN